jgi:hypothetical protein
MRLNKRGVLGEGILIAYRLVIVTLIALIILGLSAVFYEYYIDVRESEAIILGRQTFDCITSGGVVELDSILKTSPESLADYCSFGVLKGVYLVAEFYDSSGSLIKEFNEGDSTISSIYSFYLQSGVDSTEPIKKYRPDRVFIGLLSPYYGPIRIQYDGKEIEGRFLLDVFSKGEFE